MSKARKKKDNSNSPVPILFTSETAQAIDLLVQHRSQVGIADTNEYLFARGKGQNYLVGWDTLQAISKQIVLKKPKLITPTRTRKWLATMMQLLEMTDAELTWLTNHMRHSKNVHFAWHRKEDTTIKRTKVAKVLSAIDEGEDIANKKIDALMCADSEKGCYILLYLCIKNFILTKPQVLFHFLSIFLFQICPGLTFSLLINEFVGVAIIIASEVKIYAIFMFSDK